MLLCQYVYKPRLDRMRPSVQILLPAVRVKWAGSTFYIAGSDSRRLPQPCGIWLVVYYLPQAVSGIQLILIYIPNWDLCPTRELPPPSPHHHTNIYIHKSCPVRSLALALQQRSLTPRLKLPGPRRHLNLRDP